MGLNPHYFAQVLIYLIMVGVEYARTNYGTSCYSPQEPLLPATVGEPPQPDAQDA